MANAVPRSHRQDREGREGDSGPTPIRGFACGGNYQRNEQMYSQIPVFTSMVKPELPATSKYWPAA